jgi:hypothetical protein
LKRSSARSVDSVFGRIFNPDDIFRRALGRYLMKAQLSIMVKRAGSSNQGEKRWQSKRATGSQWIERHT